MNAVVSRTARYQGTSANSVTNSVDSSDFSERSADVYSMVASPARVIVNQPSGEWVAAVHRRIQLLMKRGIHYIEFHLEWV